MNLHARAAKLLGWTEADAHSVSLSSLRELIRPLNPPPKLLHLIDEAIRSGEYIT